MTRRKPVTAPRCDEPPSQLRVVSYGGGVQSTAILVLAARGDIEIDAFLFANVGSDSENPATTAYVTDVAQPYAARHGIRLEIVRHTLRKESVTLRGEIERRTTSYVIPVHFEKSGMGRRKCTYDFKIQPIARWLKQHGASKDNPAVLSLGISTDEMQRMRTHSGFDHYTLRYPLVERRLYRDGCEQIITEEGIPVPPKSSCFFCPFHSLQQWATLRRDRPDLYEQAAEIEDVVSDRMMAREGSPVFLSGKRLPLRSLFGPGVQPDLFADEADSCESGYCMT